MFETILSCRIGSFIVDKTAVKVEATPMGAVEILKTPSGLYRFQKKDNILFKSFSLALPYCFSQADDRASVHFQYYDANAPTWRSVTELEKVGRLWAFSENTEIELQTFFKWPTIVAAEPFLWFGAIADQHVHPTMGFSNIWISMLNCPSALPDLTELPIWAFLKVHHTLEISEP